MAGGDASSGEEVNAGFEFAFDNEAFSDKVLRLEVFGSDDAPGSGTDAASCKRRREEAQGDDGEGIASCTLMAKPILRVKTIHINSAILAAKSHFFFKLFSSGMKGSERQTTLRIANSEENTFMELLHFLYSGKLSLTTEATLLVDIMMASEKFEVVSCMRLCRQRLRNLPVIPESSVTSLDLSCSNLVAAELTEAAKIFLAKRYEAFLSREFEDELMRIPLAGIEAILSKE